MLDNIDFDDGIIINDNDGIITVNNLENASIRASYKRLPQNVYDYYKTIKNELLTNNKVLSRTYVGKECFYVDADTIAKFNIIDNELYFYAKLSPEDRGRTEFFETPNHNVDPNQVLTLVILKKDADLKSALELVYSLKQKYNI